jgi:hypothetical protein
MEKMMGLSVIQEVTLWREEDEEVVVKRRRCPGYDRFYET